MKPTLKRYKLVLTIIELEYKLTHILLQVAHLCLLVVWFFFVIVIVVEGRR